MIHKRKIVGIQTHHHVQYADAVRHGVNLCSALRGVLTITGDPDVERLEREASDLLLRVCAKESAARASFQRLWEEDPETFVKARDGLIPWPDETVAGFQARCFCYDSCPVHDRGWEDQACRCYDACPAHPEER